MARRALVIAVFLTLSFHLAYSYASAQPAQNSANQQQGNAAQNSQPSPANSVLQVDHAPSERNETGKANDDRQTRKHIIYDLVAQFPAWIQAALAILLFVWVVRQTRIADQQREIMQETIKTSEATERAYIGIGDMKISNLAVGQIPTIIVTWVNGGRTPARNFRAMPILVFGKEPVTDKIHFIDDDISPISSSFIPAGEAKVVNYPLPSGDRVTEENWTAFQRGQLNVYIIGNVVYRDIRGAKHVEPISAMYDRHDNYVYETYAYSDPDNQS